MMPTTRYFVRALLSLCLFSGAVLADEAPRQFDIELLIFQNLNDDDGGEVWPVDYSSWFEEDTPAFDDTPADDSATPSAQPDTVTNDDERPWLPEDQLRLQAEERALKRSASYRPLRHLAWRQTVLDRTRAQAIDIPPAPDDAPVRIEGTARVAVERYLHLYLDLKLVDTSLTLNAEFSDYELPEFRLSQHRRMRSKELHYFDHPKFGVIALITPYIPPEPAPEPLAPEPATSRPVTDSRQ